jgi:SPP1 family predicted phage head-tail adaptor
MRPGKLDRKIRIEVNVPTRNAAGESVPNWQCFHACWADVRPMRADERHQADARHSVRVSNFRVRYKAGVLPDMRVVYESLNWRITGIAEVGRREGLDITAEAIY